MALPACVARIVQVPVVTDLTVLPLTVQTALVSEAKLTGKPDDAVALTLKGGSVTSLSGNWLKVIVCSVVPAGMNSYARISVVTPLGALSRRGQSVAVAHCLRPPRRRWP